MRRAPTHRWRGGRVAEGGGLLNRYTVNPVSWVRIPSPPPLLQQLVPDVAETIRAPVAGLSPRSSRQTRCRSGASGVHVGAHPCNRDGGTEPTGLVRQYALAGAVNKPVNSQPYTHRTRRR